MPRLPRYAMLFVVLVLALLSSWLPIPAGADGGGSEGADRKSVV